MSKIKSVPVPLILLAILIAGGLILGIEQYVTGIGHITTDDAYVSGDIDRIAPQISGTVAETLVANTQFVEKGQVLVRLDDHDAIIALDHARANLGQAVRDTAQIFAKLQGDRANVEVQKINLARAKQDLERDEPLLPIHAISEETIQHERQNAAVAAANLKQAEAALAATSRFTAGTNIEHHPRVLQAASALRTAWLTLSRTEIPAPRSGFVMRKNVQPGDQVTTAKEVMAVLALNSVWIDANLKETQLNDIRIGQAATVTTDIYGKKIQYHGKVMGISPGTGSALSILPAQNATGNWIKIVQRLAVRIALNPNELTQHPLFLGLSAMVDINTHDRSGLVLSTQPVWSAEVATDIFAGKDKGINEEIKHIIEQNLVKSTGDTSDDGMKAQGKS